MDHTQPDEAAIFNAARRIVTPKARDAYLRRACGDDLSLLARVEALLRMLDLDPNFLDSPIEVKAETLSSLTSSSAEAAVASTPTSERPGSRIGPYKLIEQIGEGGFGVVFLAEQQQPVRRTVALKVLKPGMDTRQVVARFEAERQALALMDHPNIARVLDGGETVSGRPFFVMELVKGVSITRYCDEHQLTPRERLALFVPVCQAVQHAHQKGIIHRDLKPTNILVAAYDGRPVPKVIDFGVAKALGQQLTERTLVTGFHSVVGTLEYMSPEQAEFNAADIDTRADIYSLGVLLYELLTGTTPLPKERLTRAALTEALRLIREEEPPRPSTRLSESRDVLASISARRRLEPARLNKELRGELDWIVMKALDKDRGRRYETANGLMQDIQRYLQDQPVEACPPSVSYRLRKFAHAYRRELAVALALAVLLVTAAAISTWEASQARAAERQAEMAHRGEAEQRKQAESVLRFVQDHVFAAARPKGRPGGLGSDVSLRQALDAALPAVGQSFTTQPLVEARVRMTLGMSFQLLGDSRIAAEQFLLARALYTEHLGPDHPDTLESAQSLATAYADVGRNPEALTLREEVLALRKARLGPDHVDTIQSMRNLANSYAAVNRLADALKLDEETVARAKVKLGPAHPVTIAAMNNLAQDYTDLGRHADALQLQVETLALQKSTFGPDHPDTLNGMTNVGNAYANLNRFEDANTLREETLKLQKANLPADHPHLLTSLYNLANGYGKVGRHKESLALHRQALAGREAKLGPGHIETVHSLWGVAAQLVALGQGAEAVPIIDEGLRRAAAMSPQPDVLGLANLRMSHFARAKDPAGCQATAELWESMHRTDAASLYNAACYRAVTAAVVRTADQSPSAATEADHQADLAMQRLRQAIDAGYANRANLKTDSDLDALRARSDFQKLIAEPDTGNGPK